MTRAQLRLAAWCVLVGACGYVVSEALSSAGILSWRLFANLNAGGPAFSTLFAQTVVAFALRVVAVLLVLCMASALESKRRVDGATLARALSVIALLLILGGVAAVLVVPTFGLSLIAFGACAFYAIAGVFIGKRDAIDAIVESGGCAGRRPAQSAGLALGIVAAAIAGSFAGDLAGWLLTMLAAGAAGTVAAAWYALQSAPDQAP